MFLTCLSITFGFSQKIEPEGRGNKLEGLELYPNPIKEGELYITTKNNGTKNIFIYDVLGELILHTVLHSTRLDLNHVEKGIYIIIIAEEDKRSSRKLIIK